MRRKFIRQKIHDCHAGEVLHCQDADSGQLHT
jgi:hypothetical protein